LEGRLGKSEKSAGPAAWGTGDRPAQASAARPVATGQPTPRSAARSPHRNDPDTLLPMKTIGLVGGMSWESSLEYYRIVNERVRDRLGGLHSARCVMYSFDFDEIETLQQRGAWDEATHRMIDAARALERAGAEFVVICTNTMHMMAADVEAAIGIPLLHIADATAGRIKAQGLRTVGLLATRFTMEQDFYKGRLVEKHGLEVLVPPAEDRRVVHDVIYNELCRGQIRDESRQRFRQIIRRLAGEGVAGVILGCTEIGLLIKQADSPVPLFDTAVIHAEAAADFALQPV
jgi:aspartate racemase